MGRQDNIEIFEDTQRIYSSNQRLISAIQHSSEAQEYFGNRRQLIGFDERCKRKTPHMRTQSMVAWPE